MPNRQTCCQRFRGAASTAQADTAGDEIRPLILITRPQAVDPAQFQAAQL